MIYLTSGNVSELVYELRATNYTIIEQDRALSNERLAAALSGNFFKPTTTIVVVRDQRGITPDMVKREARPYSACYLLFAEAISNRLLELVSTNIQVHKINRSAYQTILNTIKPLFTKDGFEALTDLCNKDPLRAQHESRRFVLLALAQQKTGSIQPFNDMDVLCYSGQVSIYGSDIDAYVNELGTNQAIRRARAISLSDAYRVFAANVNGDTAVVRRLRRRSEGLVFVLSLYRQQVVCERLAANTALVLFAIWCLEHRQILNSPTLLSKVNLDGIHRNYRYGDYLPGPL